MTADLLEEARKFVLMDRRSRPWKGRGGPLTKRASLVERLADELELLEDRLKGAQRVLNSLYLVTRTCAKVPCTERLMGNCGECVACRAKVFVKQEEKNARLLEALEKLDSHTNCSGNCKFGDGRVPALCARHTITRAILEKT